MTRNQKLAKFFMTESESVEKGLARVDYPATTMNHSVVIESLNSAHAKLDKLLALLESSPVDKLAA